MQLNEFELLSKEPIYIDGVGNIKIPTLKDIRKIGYNTYELLTSYLSVDLKKYIDFKGLRDQYDKLNDEGKKFNTLYNLIIRSDDFGEVYRLIFSFFISENIKFNVETESFEFYIIESFEESETNTFKKSDGSFLKSLFEKINIFNLFNHKSSTTIADKNISKEKIVITGVINNENFDIVRNCLLLINKLKETEIKIDDKQPVYKNEMARKLVERMEKAEKAKQEKNKDNLSFGKMISKYCADNKSGINMLNVWDMTIYQFYDQFAQHNYIRQSDIQDMVYANTVNFSDIKEYDSQLWLK